MSDAFSGSLVDRQANVAAKAFVRYQTRREFSRMQTDVHGRWILRAQKFEHAHLHLIIRHGDVAILRHDEIDAHKTLVSFGEFKTENSLREDLLLREAPQHLAEITNLHAATRSFIGLPATLTLRAQSFRLIQFVRGSGDV